MTALLVRDYSGGKAAPSDEVSQSIQGPVRDTKDEPATESKTEEEPATDPEPPLAITPKTEFARALAAGEIHSVMLIGDSISAGEGGDNYELATDGQLLFTDAEGESYYEPYATNEGWADALRTYLEKAGVEDFLNASIPGSSFTWLLRVFDAWVGDGADAIIVMLGTNDALVYNDTVFGYVCQWALKKLAESCTYLLVITPPNNERIDLINLFDIKTVDTIITNACDEGGYELISAYDALEPGTSDYCPDQVHPTTEGSEKLWEYLAAEIGLG